MGCAGRLNCEGLPETSFAAVADRTIEEPFKPVALKAPIGAIIRKMSP
jgi:hypothetical protein